MGTKITGWHVHYSVSLNRRRFRLARDTSEENNTRGNKILSVLAENRASIQ